MYLEHSYPRTYPTTMAWSNIGGTVVVIFGYSMRTIGMITFQRKFLYACEYESMDHRNIVAMQMPYYLCFKF